MQKKILILLGSIIFQSAILEKVFAEEVKTETIHQNEEVEVSAENASEIEENKEEKEFESSHDEYDL